MTGARSFATVTGVTERVALPATGATALMAGARVAVLAGGDVTPGTGASAPTAEVTGVEALAAGARPFATVETVGVSALATRALAAEPASDVTAVAVGANGCAVDTIGAGALETGGTVLIAEPDGGSATD